MLSVVVPLRRYPCTWCGEVAERIHCRTCGVAYCTDACRYAHRGPHQSQCSELARRVRHSTTEAVLGLEREELLADVDRNGFYRLGEDEFIWSVICRTDTHTTGRVDGRSPSPPRWHEASQRTYRCGRVGTCARGDALDRWLGLFDVVRKRGLSEIVLLAFHASGRRVTVKGYLQINPTVCSNYVFEHPFDYELPFDLQAGPIPRHPRS